jgi:hypothetical protein
MLDPEVPRDWSKVGRNSSKKGAYYTVDLYFGVF